MSVYETEDVSAILAVPTNIMLKLYKTISGLKGILEGTRIPNVEFEYQDSMLDLAEVNAVYPDKYFSIISNSTEFNKRRDDEWIKENPNPSPGMYPPSVMSTLMASNLPCVTIQIGAQLFHFNEDQKIMFDLVCTERNNENSTR